ncbi:MAG: hypothetical protein V1820_05980 [archaeon]
MVGKKGGEVSATVKLPGGAPLEKNLKAELAAERGVSVAKSGKAVEITVSKGAESWATLRSKVNTTLRIVETVENTIKGIAGKEKD